MNRAPSHLAPLSKTIRRFLLEHLRSYSLALLLLIGGTGLTVYIWNLWQAQELRQARDKHSQYIKLENEKIQLRIRSFIENLYAIRAASESRQIHQNQNAWDDYLEKLGIFDRYGSVQAIGVYQVQKQQLRLLRKSQHLDYQLLPTIELDEHQASQLQFQIRNNLPFAYFEDQEEGVARSVPVLKLFIGSTLRSGLTRLYGFQIHLPLLMEELFGDKITTRPFRNSSGYTEVMSINVANARYNVYFVVTEDYVNEMQHLSTIFLITALIFNFMLFLLIIFLSQSRERALKLAHQMTREYRRAKQEADEANEAKSEFLARMSHEIRTPLNAIVGVGDLLRETGLNEVQQGYTNLFMTSSEMLLSVINDVLDISKIESGHLEIESIPFDMPGLVINSVELFRSKAQTRRVHLEYHISKSVVQNYIGDPTRIRQILTNLISNALKFSSPDSRIDVYLDQKPHPEDARIHILTCRVSDQGVGIPADRLESVFESFTQVDSSTT
ncbi:MAG: hypothetical protein KDK39_05455, partial [Leptospiraceae bacterium]|nr:hypothetical protein [Leptospiraceae bacterium]